MAESNALLTKSLKRLQSDGERKVMDIVDKLRRVGLSSVLELPQLVVCGDQSSGKSSVLEAITEIPFPRKENLCTRFATEIVLRRQATTSVSITINPDKLRTKIEQAELATFARTIGDLNELPTVIEAATNAMGLGKVGGNKAKAFSRDVLSVEIGGPDRPQLTLVDLPGLIHSTNRAQTESDKELILNLVKEYMKNPRTIILAIISAKNDFANQIILDFSQKVDKKGRRTLGIITKPDFLRTDSENEQSWLDLAQNKDIYLERGWHMLRNRADNEMHFSFQERNDAETAFFSRGRYVNLPRDCVGIETLRTRLSSLLLRHLIKELPALRDEMNVKLQATNDELLNLGEKRDTPVEQRMLLMKISMEINGILTAAVNGHYKHPFFGDVNMDLPVDSSVNIKRFRAVVQHQNNQFARHMRLHGHQYTIAQNDASGNLFDDAAEENDELEDGSEAMESHSSSNEMSSSHADENESDEERKTIPLPSPKCLSKEQAIAWVKKVIEKSRGHELPGSTNSEVISQIFWEQSKPWKELAHLHIDTMAGACKAFVYLVLNHAAPKEFHERLAALTVDAALDAALKSSREELQKLLDDKSRNPMTYNHYFTTTIQKHRHHKFRKLANGARSKATQTATYGTYGQLNTIDANLFEDHMSSAIEEDMAKFSADEALVMQRAYYKDELKYFIHAITKQVVERYLVDPLPRSILSPLVVTKMTDEEVSYVAAEPAEVSKQRQFLEQRKAMLEKGLETFREAMGGLKY